MNGFIEIYKQTLTYKAFCKFRAEFFDWFETLGEVGNIFGKAIKYIFTWQINKNQYFEQAVRFGIEALPMTLGMVWITGMIIALQIAHEMVKQGAGDFVGALVSLTIIRELGPLMGCFSIIAFIGSSMSAEIATMKVTDQVDAIKILGIDPIKYLIVPRVLAGAFTMPFVILLANIAGIAGGLLSSKMMSEMNTLVYIHSIWSAITVKDVMVSLLKAFVFGGIIALLCSAIGYKTEGGAMEVGKATTKAVVWSFVAMVVADYIISLIFFN